MKLENKPPVFITGATGFIGEKLAVELAGRGEKVRALIRNRIKAKGLTHPNIELIEGNLDDPDTLKKGVEGCDRVFHLAAYAKAWSKDATMFERVNFHGSIRLLEVAKEQGVKKIVVTSTAGVLGHSKNGESIAEHHRGEHRLMTNYERSKAKLEQSIEQLVKGGFPVVTVNPARVYGPGPFSDSNGEVMVMQRYIKGRFRFLPGDGSSSGSYGYIDDVVEGHILAMEKGRIGERYILGGDNASFREFFNHIAIASNKKYKMYGVPLPLLMGFARLQLFMANNFGTRPIITPELVRKFSKQWNFSSEKAKRELGYSPRSLEDGIKDTLEWMKKDGVV